MALILALSFYEPQDVSFTRSVAIHAPTSMVFEEIRNFDHWNNWNTFLHNDSLTEITYAGQSGAVGSKYKWHGDERRTGTGSLTCTDVTKNTFSYMFEVTEPGEFVGDGTFRLSDSTDFTIVSWTFHKHFPFLANATLIVFDLEKYFADDFNKSLENLKSLTEKT